MKKVLLIVIDAFASRVAQPAMERGDLPNFAALAQAAVVDFNCISMFPSITPAATATIATGQYPVGHGIAGAYWYDTDTDEVVYYSDDIWAILKLGVGAFFDDFLRKLNDERLQAPTIFQHAERAGLQAACLNYMIFRGDVQHCLELPLLMRLLPGAPEAKQVYGPSRLFLGDFIADGFEEVGKLPHKARGLKHRFGLDDAHTAELLVHLVQRHALPHVTLAYFPDNDFDSHEVGPGKAVRTLRQMDEYLGEIAGAFGGLDEMLHEVCIVITGDHSQCDIVDDADRAGINLDDVLKEFQIAEVGTPWKDGDQLVACPNLRTAQIYLRDPNANLIERAVADLLADERIDQVLRRADLVDPSARGYFVVTRDRGTLHFWRGDDGPGTAADVYGCAWSWNGSLAALDGTVDQVGVLHFGEYPNAFERIAGGLDHADAGHLWVTAQPGYEFCLPTLGNDDVHVGGGSHGSLHALDSTVPLFVGGAPPEVVLPPNPRTADVTPLCMAVLGLEPQPPLAASRAFS